MVVSRHRAQPAGARELQDALEQFLAAYPACTTTQHLDALRASDYRRLDETGHVYMDYNGGSLYGESQLEAHMALLRSHVFGNPHSLNPASEVASQLVERTREAVLAYFNASPGEYVAIFTPNASGALKLVGEAYPFGPDDHYLLTFDNHNSVIGIREFARARGARTTYVPVVLPDMRVDKAQLRAHLDRPSSALSWVV